jgi:hypothetical protein
LKRLLLALAAIAILGLTACGGSSSSSGTATGPLKLDDRVPNEADAPGSKPDPVEARQTAINIREFDEKMGDAFINPTDQEKKDFQTVDFVQAIHDTRYYGAVHSKDDPHIFSLVVQFGSIASAKEMADFFHTDGLRPCPRSCATSVSEFDVSGIPGATGVRRLTTEDAIKAAGTSEDHPYDSYAIFFSDGVFAYNIVLGGPPGTTSEDKAKEIAGNLYDRVQGVPAAD